MVLGSASQKIQTIVELAEELYERVNELREQLQKTRETLDAVDSRLGTVEGDLTEQRALVLALCEEQGIDVDAVLAGVTRPDDGPTAEDVADGEAADGDDATEATPPADGDG